MKYLFLFLLIFMVGCNPNSDSENKAPERKINPFSSDWFKDIPNGTLGDYKCINLQKVSLNEISKLSLFENMLLDQYGVEAIYKSTWSNFVEKKDTDNLIMYWASFVDEINAYGIYSTLPNGVDQSALRGGTSKRIGRTLIGLKDNWVVWSALLENDSKASMLQLEPIFAGVYKMLPGGNWMIPQSISSLKAIIPKPEKIEVVPKNYMGVTGFETMLVAKFNGQNGEVELFGLSSSDYKVGEQQFKLFVDWLKSQDLAVIIYSNEGTKSLFLTDKSIGPIYLVLDKQGLKGVRGIDTVSEAQAMVARWER